MSDRAKLEFHRYDYAAFMTFFVYAASSVVVPVALVQISETLNFHLDKGGMGAGGFIQMGRSIAMTLFLILSGFIAGRMGLRRSIGYSVLLMGTGCLAASLAPGYAVLFLAILLAGCGEGYVEAAATPFVQKLHVKDTGQYMNFAHSFWSVGVAATTVGAGFALMTGVPWRIIIFSVFILTLFPAIWILLPEQKGHEYPEEKNVLSVRVIACQTWEIMKVPRFWLFFLLLFIAGGAEYCLTFWLASFMQLSMKTGALMGGMATAVFALGMVAGRMGWGIFVPQNKLGISLLGAAVTGLILTCLIPFLTPDLSIGRTWVLVILLIMLFLTGISIAPLWPTLQTYAVDRLPEGLSETMIFILLSSAGVPGCGFFTTLMGVLGDRLGSLTAAFFMVPLCELVIALLMLWEIRQKRV